MKAGEQLTEDQLAQITGVSRTPVREAVRRLEDGLFIEALSNGPTLAFKDFAMQLIGQLFQIALARDGRRITIVGATSGDTGSAAIEAFRALQPDNPLGNYLGAQAAFAAGDYAKAAQDLLHSMDQGVLRNQSLRLLEATGEAYAEAGYEPTAALIAGLGKSVGVTLEQSRLSVAIKAGLQTMQDEFVKAADFDAVEPTLRVGLDLGRRLQDPKAMVVEQLTGLGIEAGFLRQLDPVTLVDGGLRAGERLGQLEAQSAEFRELTDAAVTFSKQATDEDVGRYFEILRRDGELAAVRWAKERVGK